jgi:hypothetical protein
VERRHRGEGIDALAQQGGPSAPLRDGPLWVLTVPYFLKRLWRGEILR